MRKVRCGLTVLIMNDDFLLAALKFELLRVMLDNLIELLNIIELCFCSGDNLRPLTLNL